MKPVLRSNRSFVIFACLCFRNLEQYPMDNSGRNLFLDLVKRQEDYVIYRGDQPLKTTGGTEVAHKNSRLMKHILTDLIVVPAGQPVLSFLLFEFQCDMLTQGKDPVQQNLSNLLEADPFVRLKSGHPPKKQSIGNPMTDTGMELSLWVSSELLAEVNGFFEEHLKQADMIEAPEDPFAAVIVMTYSGLSGEQKSAVNWMVREHESGIVLPVMLALEKISPAEYTKGMISFTKGDQHQREYQVILHEVSVLYDYLLASRPVRDPSWNLEEMIRLGEGSSLEFKSTLRWDLRQGKTGQHIERACLKTISAFLNSDGGTLLIGIRDDGSVEGIESDRLDSDDRWLLHLWTLVRTCFGKDISPYIRTRLERLTQKMVCRIDCMRSPRPVFLKQPGFEEEFYIRVGPGNAALAVSEALRYIADRFPGA